MTTTTPFADLDPTRVLDAIAAAGFVPDGRLLQLNSYENRVWQVGLEEPAQGASVVVAKFYRPGRWSDAQILEEHAFLAEAAAAELPVAAPLPLRSAQGDKAATLVPVAGTALRLAVTARRAGRAPELEEAGVLTRLGSAVARLHRVGEARAFVHRRAINAQTLGHDARALVVASGAVDAHQHADWLATSERALALVDAAFARHGPPALLRLHGDAHAGNVLWRAEASAEGNSGPLLVDFDDCGMGPAVQDLWMLLPGEATNSRTDVAAAWHHLRSGYEALRPFDARELALVEPLRTLRMIHHSAWLAARWADPAFPTAFPWFASPSYWAQQAMALREQCAAMAAAQ